MSAPLQSRMTANGRTYTDPLTGDTFPSVTNILNVIDKPALIPWAARMAAEYAYDRRETLGVMDRAEYVDTVKTNWRRKRDDAADRGTNVHAAVEEYLRSGGTLDADEWEPNVLAHVEQFQRFARDHRPTLRFVETTVYSPRYGYAGTLDMLADLHGRGLWLIDVKTGGVWPEAALQLCAYRNADYLITGPPWERHDMPPVDGCAVLDLKPDRYDLVAVDTSADVLDAFVFAAELAAFRRERFPALVGSPLVPTRTGEL